MSGEQSTWLRELQRIRVAHRDAVDQASNRLENIASRSRSTQERQVPPDQETAVTYLLPANLDTRAVTPRPDTDDDQPRTSWLV